MKKRFGAFLLCTLLFLGSTNVSAANDVASNGSVSLSFDKATVTIKVDDVDATSGQFSVNYDEDLYKFVSANLSVKYPNGSVKVEDVNSDEPGKVSLAYASSLATDQATLTVKLASKDGKNLSEFSADVNQDLYTATGEKEATYSVAKEKEPVQAAAEEVVEEVVVIVKIIGKIIKGLFGRWF